VVSADDSASDTASDTARASSDANPAGEALGAAAAADPTTPANERQPEVVRFILSKLRLEELNATAPVDPAVLRVEQTGIDSLELTELIMELEDRYRVTIDDALLSDSTTVVELAEHIAARMP
jgi:acyl carrier protein